MGMPEEDIGRSLGKLEGALRGFQENWAEQDRRAAEGRRILYGKFEELQTGFIGITHQVAGVVRDVAEMKPAVTDWVRTKDKAIGATTAASILGKMSYLVAGSVIALAVWLVDHFVVK
jgi:hypothetical protein